MSNKKAYLSTDSLLSKTQNSGDIKKSDFNSILSSSNKGSGHNFKNNSDKINKEYISGLVERITYHNLENGFCVIRVNVKGHRDLVTVTGNVPAISPGEYIKASGIWHNDKNHGLQFKADFLKSLPPDTLEGIEKYLGSGLIKGIGPHFAKKLVGAFKERVFDVIEFEPELLSTIDGIGKFRASSICNNWKEQKIVREIMVFLQSHGVGTTRATRIYKTYGDASIEVVSENPYKLAKDIRGIGFVSADTIAMNLGIAKDSLIRARAGISYALLEATSEGHCGLPRNKLIEDVKELLGIETCIIEAAIESEILDETITVDYLDGEVNNHKEEKYIFLTSYYIYEKHIAYLLKILKSEELPWKKIDIDIPKAIDWVESKIKIKLADTQAEALTKALQTKVMVITGGPGTGKTTLINSILKILEAKKLRIKLAAPTGRAAKRLSESTSLEALTIHRLLEIDPKNGKFKYNEDNLLKCDYLVIDEVSMVDVALFNSLLKALPKSSALLMIGDVDQLPSVGAGQVLGDIIDSKSITTIKLTEIFRQAATSDIIINSHLINKGQMPNLNNRVRTDTSKSTNNSDSSTNTSTSTNTTDGQREKLEQNSSSKPDTDFYFIAAEPGEDLIKKLITLVKDRIPKKFNLDPITDIQILSPMQRGGSGVRALNTHLQEVFNPNLEHGITKYGQTFALQDKVMQLENDYDKEVYNGDIGIITHINNEEQELEITFDGRNLKYDYSDLDQITLAYATTIHKSQGSEYPAVIIPLTMQSFMMLKRNLIYTAITRGKKLVIILGQKKALAIAVKNGKNISRYTKLKSWLQI